MKNDNKTLELSKKEIVYLLGMMEMDIRYSKDEENLKMAKKLFNYFGGKINLKEKR